MLFKVQELELKPIRFEAVWQPGEIDFLDSSQRLAAPLHAKGKAEWIASVGEIRVEGELNTVVESDCDRCLEPSRFPVEAKFDLFYRAMETLAVGGDVGLSGSETDVGFFEGDGLELADLLREQILLALPVQRLCQPDCLGLCRECGVNRNRIACSCAANPTDDRWTALQGLKSARLKG